MTNKEVWISSIIHQEELSKISENTSIIRKMFGMYKLPTNFPSIKMMWQNLPVVCHSKSSLDVLEDRFVFSPLNNLQRNAYQNIEFDFRRIILFQDITSVEIYTNPKPFLKSFNIDWINLRYNIHGQEESMLLCCGGKFMKTIGKETNNMFQILKEKTENIPKQ